MSAGAPCRFLEWDSSHFNRRIARIEGPALTAARLREIAAWCAAERIDCVYFLAAPGDEAGIRLAQEAGYRRIETRVTLERENRAPDEAPDEGRVRPFSAGDLPRLREIARTRHTATRFYRDPGFPRDRCADLYEIWISKACAGEAQRVLVACWGEEPVGYVTCKGNGEGRIDLIAVAEAAEGRGLGRALVSEALRWFAGRPLRGVSVVTQGDNAAARALYERCGFRARSEQVYFHGWFGPDGKVIP